MYLLFVATALLLVLFLTESRSSCPELARSTVLWGTLGGIVGGRLWIVVERQELALSGAVSSWGFVLGGSLSVLIVLSFRDQLPAAGSLADAAAPGLALAGAIARFGCFWNGCDFGKVTTVPWAVRYLPGSLGFAFQTASFGVSVEPSGVLGLHPTQLYEAIPLLILAPLLWRLPVGRGAAAASLAISYGILRFGVEFFRADYQPLNLLHLSIAQVLALLALATGGWILCRATRWAGSHSLSHRS